MSPSPKQLPAATAWLARRLPRVVTQTLERWPQLASVLHVSFVLVAFVAIDHFMNRAGDLPEASYAAPSVLPGLWNRIGIPISFVLALSTYILARYGQLFDGWDSFYGGGTVRRFVFVLALVLAWPFALYGFNYFFAQSHLLERSLILLLVPLIWWRPVFVAPFVLLAYTLMWQLGEPSLSSGAIFPLKVHLLRVLNLFVATFAIHSITGSRRADAFWFLTGCLVASGYWIPGIGKVQIGWLGHGHVYRMPIAAYGHGWLSFLEPTTVVRFAQMLSWFDWPMRIFVMVVEVGSLLFLSRRSWALALIAAATMFHIATFALYGYLLWTWMILNVGLFLVLARDRRSRSIQIFTKTHFAASILLIVGASYWARPPALAWFDVRLNYVYRLEAIGESGKRYDVPPSFFSPYDDIFTMSNFSYLVSQHGVLTSPYGSADRVRADRLMDARTAADIFALEAEVGRQRYHQDSARRFYRFVTRYVTNWNAREGPRPVPTTLTPLRHFWSFPGPDAFAGEEKIREIIVKEFTYLYDETKLSVIRELELHRIILPEAPS